MLHAHRWKKEEGAVFKKCLKCGKRKKANPKPKKGALKKKCDALWSKLTKEFWESRYGKKCAWCGKVDFAHSDHIVNRWKHTTRWNLENCVCLCAPCHLYRKKREPAEWARMVQETIGVDKFEALLEAGQSMEHADYQQVYDYLVQTDHDKPWLKKE